MINLISLYKSSITIILFAVVGVISGLVFKEKVVFLKPIGDLFINLIKMTLVPVIFFTVISAVANLSTHKNALRLSGFSAFYFFMSSFLASLVGILLLHTFTPGVGNIEIPTSFLQNQDDLGESVSEYQLTFWGFIFYMIPENPFKTLSEGNLLSILFFSIFFGIAISYTQHRYKYIVTNSISVLGEVFLWMVNKIMLLAPIAVFSLLSYLVATIGVEVLYFVSKLLIVILLGLILWLYGFLGVIVTLFSKVSYFNFVKTIVPLQLFAFSTSSSLVSLPKNIETCEKMGVSKSIYNVILPMSATLNMNGSALYYSSLTVFFAQLLGVDLSMYTYILIAFTATIGAMSTPGIPGLSLTVLMVMSVANIPLIGLPLIIAIDRILDMFITVVNVVGDTVAALVVDKFYYKK